MIETIRLSEKARNQLIILKKRTGLQNWNVLCRWALLRSLAEPSVPPDENIPADSSVEMSWKTFSGGREGLYWGLVCLRAANDGVDQDSERIAKYFRLHLHRGISYLYADGSITSIGNMLRLTV